MATSFVIPCYREEEALAALRPHLAAIPADEIVFVDDGSDDGTAAALAALAGEGSGGFLRGDVEVNPTLSGAEVTGITKIADDDFGTVGREAIGDRSADALGGAGDDDGLA